MPDFIVEFTSRIGIGAIYPIYDALFSGSVRFFWLYMLTGLAMAAIWHYRQTNSDPFYARLFNREVWTSASAINDYYVMVINSVIRVVILGALLAHLKVITTWTTELLKAAGVSGTQTTSNSVLIALALTITLFIARDAARFYMHYLMHKIPSLWEFHKVHHSAEVLNFFTSERFHPLEVVISSVIMITVTSIVNGIFIALYGDTLTPLTIAGANGFWVAGNVFGGVLRHSPFPVSFGKTIEKWIVSPSMHHIHHSDSVEHYDRNMGSALTLWDRMAGTHLITEGQEITAFGIGEETRAFRSLKEIYVRPIVAVYNKYRGRSPLVAGE